MSLIEKFSISLFLIFVLVIIWFCCTDPVKPDFIAPTIGNNDQIQTFGTMVVDSTFGMYISAEGNAPLSFEWQKNKVLLYYSREGAVNDTLKFSPLTLADSGTYRCIVSNNIGSDTSSEYQVKPYSDTIKPVITLISPQNGSTTADSLLNISFKVTDEQGISSVTVNGTTVTSADSIYTHTLKLALGLNKDTIIAADVSIKKNRDTLVVTFTYDPTFTDTIKPVIALISPQNGATTDDSLLNIRFKVTDKSGISSVTVNSTAVTSTDSVYTHTLKLLLGQNKDTIIATDASTKKNRDTLVMTFTYDPTFTDTIKPVITLISPQNGATTDDSLLNIRFKVTDKSGISSVKVNGTTVASTDSVYNHALKLSLGLNNDTIIAVDASTKKNCDTLVMTFTYDPSFTDTIQPVITLISPQNGSTTADSLLNIIFKVTDKSGISSVKVNGTTVASTDSVYNYAFKLSLGLNKDTIIAIDGSTKKNCDTLLMTFTYDPTIVDTIKPSINKNSPAGKYVKTSTITFSVKVVDASGISLVTINGDTVTSSNDTYSKQLILASGINNVTVMAKDASSNANKDTVTFIIVYDSVLPALSRYNPAQDSTVTSSNARKIEIVAKDNYGIKDVAFSVGTTNYPVTVFNDTIYYATITDLVHNVFAIVNIQAKDSAENSTALNTAIKYDSTLSDIDPPAFVYNSGPKNNERVKTATGAIRYTITDKTGIDSVYYRLNGAFVGQLTSLGNSLYECSYDLASKYGINTIKIFAVDKAVNHNKDSVVINLNFNTVPTAVSNIYPPDKSININAETGVTLSWNAATDMDGDTIKYIVYYGLDTTNLSSPSLITTTFPIPSPAGASKYFWCVAVCTKLDTIRCPSSSFYTFTTINKKTTISGFADTVCSIKDTISFSVTASDPQGIKEYHWDFDNDGSANIVTTTGTASFITGSSAVTLKAVLYVIDNKNDSTTDTASITVLVDPPTVYAGADTTCYKGKQITLTGVASDRYGSIVRQGWDLGATGTFQTTPDGKITFYLPTSYQKVFKCIFNATDDDNNYSFDTLIVTVSSWEIIGDFSNINLSSTTNAHYNNGNMAMHIANNGIPIVTYDLKDTNHFAILQYSGSGTTWSNLNFSTSSPFNGIWVPNVRVNANSEIHFTFTRFVVGPSGPTGPGYDYFLDCLKYNGSSWSSLGSVDVKSHHNSYDYLFDRYRQLNSLAFDNVGNPLVLTNRNSQNDMFLKRYTGTTWEPLSTDSASRVITSDSADLLCAEYSNGTAYVAYRDRSNSFYVRVLKFNGSSFETVGSSPSPSGKVSYLSFDVHGSTPYIAYIDTASGNKISVKKYDGGTWAAVGGYVSNNEADYPSLEIDENGTLYLAYRDRAQSLRPVVRRYNGTSWELLDGNEIVENVVCVDQNKICVRNNRIYVMFENDSYHLIIKEYLH